MDKPQQLNGCPGTRVARRQSAGSSWWNAAGIDEQQVSNVPKRQSSATTVPPSHRKILRLRADLDSYMPFFFHFPRGFRNLFMSALLSR